MGERIRDSTVAEAIAAEAGVDATPELLELGEIITPVVQLKPRPPLASSGYLPGTMGVIASAVALNTGHVGIFGSGFNDTIVRVNWCIIFDRTGVTSDYSLRRVDSPFTGFPSVELVPGYINAGSNPTARIFSVTKTDTVAAQGDLMATFRVQADDELYIPGPWILNDGILLIARGVVNQTVMVSFGYEAWPAIRRQAPG